MTALGATDNCLTPARGPRVNLYDQMEGGSAPPEIGKICPDYSRPMQIAPSINLIASPQRVYHSDSDIPAYVSARALTPMARGFARFIENVDKMSRADIRWETNPRATAK